MIVYLMIRLWVHEVYRVFYDRLVDDKDRAWLHSSLKKVTKEHFKEDFDAMFKHLGNSKNVSDLICFVLVRHINVATKNSWLIIHLIQLVKLIRNPGTLIRNPGAVSYPKQC